MTATTYIPSLSVADGASRLPSQPPLHRVLDACLRAVEIRRGLARIRELDDHLLRDIGLTRSQAEQAVRYGRRL